jgi:hypothetical protein
MEEETSNIRMQATPIEVVGPRFAPGINPELPYLASSAPSQGPTPKDGQWWEHAEPFRHYGATGVFDAATYARLERQFTEILDATSGKIDGEYTLKKVLGNYDAQILGFNDILAEKFAPIFTDDWLRPITSFLGMKYLPRVEGALHSNPKNSSTGWIHTDLCSGWFDEKYSDREKLTLPPRGRCNYFTGRTTKLDAEPEEYIRSATLIFYLCNDEWTSSDGGETGLYGAARETPNTEKRLVPPVNNSLLLFECSPHSYHRFVANPGRARNSIILWLHSTVENAQEKWGAAINRRPGG